MDTAVRSRDQRRPPPDIRSLISIKVDNLPRDCTVEDLRGPFEKFGEIGDIYIPLDGRTRLPKSFGFVRFRHLDDAEAAVTGMAGLEIAGSLIECALAQYGRNDQRPSRRGARSITPRRDDRYSRRDDRDDDRRRYRSRSRDRDYRRRDYRDRRDRSRSWSRSRR